MKRLFSIFLIFVFLIQSTSSLWILVSFRIQRNYIAENLCVNRFEAIPVCKGQCFLEKQLDKNEKREQKFPDLKQKEIQLVIQNITIFQFSKIDFTSNNNNYRNYRNTNLISNGYLLSVFHPPQMA